MAQRSTSEVIITLDPHDPRSRSLQIADALRHRIVQGMLRPGEAVPSTRQLARQLGVARGTVVAAFDQLLGEGYLHASQGSPTQVHPLLDQLHPNAEQARKPQPAARSRISRSAGAPNASRARRVSPSSSAVAASPPPSSSLVSLLPGRPDTTGVMGPAWRSAWRKAAADPAPTTEAGAAVLISAVADHLRVLRALPVEPEELLITSGARDGFALLLHALAAVRGRPHLRVGVEDPGYPALRSVPEALGHHIVACPVDDQGLQVEALPTGAAAPDALLVTPSHQYPLGGALSLQRRLALLRWASEHQVLLIEDDFNAQLRYVGTPLPTLAALDSLNREHPVALLGTWSTVLTPQIGCGFLRAPAWLAPTVVRLRQAVGSPVSAVTQTAVAHLLESGFVRRHIRSVRARYARRVTALQLAFFEAEHAHQHGTSQHPPARLAPMFGGVDAVIGTRASEDEVVTRCAQAGLEVGRMSRAWASQAEAHRGTDPVQGIVVGLAGLTDEVLPALVNAVV